MQTLVKVYRGKQQLATAAFLKDAELLGARGYVPTSQSWAEGSYSAATFLLALLLCILLIGIVMLVAMLIVKPAGSLTVTYTYSPTQGLVVPATNAPFEQLQAGSAAGPVKGTGDSPRGRTPSGRYAAYAIFLILVLALVKVATRDKPATSLTPPSPDQTAATAPANTPARLDPGPALTGQAAAAQLASDAGALKNMQDRLTSYQKKLIDHYATSDDVIQCEADVDVARLVSAHAAQQHSAEARSQVARANTLAQRLSEESRVLYASTLEEAFLKDGLDVHVSALGKSKEELQLTYALMSDPLIYKLQNQTGLKERAKKVGFSKLVFTNGFDSALGKTWTASVL